MCYSRYIENLQSFIRSCIEVQPAITFHDRWLQTPTLTSTNNCAKCFQSISALVHLSIYFCVHFDLITGGTWDAAAWWPSSFQQNTAREKMGEKVFSFKLALTALTFQKKEKALAWWNATGERRTNMRGLLLFKFMFYKNTKLSKRKKRKEVFSFLERKAKLSAAPSSWQDACDKIRCLPSPPLLPSLKSAIEDTVPWKYNSPRDGFNGVKCATVQLHPQWYTDLSGKSPKSGQFCTQGKWTTLAQTDLISVWFTTSNHLMSHCHLHIICPFVLLSKKTAINLWRKGNILDWAVFLLGSGLAMKWEEVGGSRQKSNIIVANTGLQADTRHYVVMLLGDRVWHLITNSYNSPI